MSAHFILTLSHDDNSDEEGDAITLESDGYTESEILEGLVRTAEAIVQRQSREVVSTNAGYEGMTDYQKEGYIAMQSRLALLHLISELEFATAVGFHFDL